MKKNENEKIFSTKDLPLITTLTTLQFFHTEVDYQVEGERSQLVAYFSFEKTPELEEVLYNFRRGKIAVEPRQFMFNLREIKSQISSVFKSPKSNFSNYKK